MESKQIRLKFLTTIDWISPFHKTYGSDRFGRQGTWERNSSYAAYIFFLKEQFFPDPWNPDSFFRHQKILSDAILDYDLKDFFSFKEKISQKPKIYRLASALYYEIHGKPDPDFEEFKKLMDPIVKVFFNAEFNSAHWERKWQENEEYMTRTIKNGGWFKYGFSNFLIDKKERKWDDFMILFENSIKISGVKMTDAQRENMKILLLKEKNVYVVFSNSVK